jgi:hypothetical protein
MSALSFSKAGFVLSGMPSARLSVRLPASFHTVLDAFPSLVVKKAEMAFRKPVPTSVMAASIRTTLHRRCRQHWERV